LRKKKVKERERGFIQVEVDRRYRWLILKLTFFSREKKTEKKT